MRLDQPLATTVTAWALVSAAAGLVVFASCGTYARKETVPGVIEPVAGVSRVLAPRVGIVLAVHAEDGAVVAAGDPLLTIGSDLTNEAGVSADRARVTQLRDKLATLKLRLADNPIEERLEQDRLQTQAQERDAQLVHLGTEIVQAQERLRLAEDALSVKRELNAKGFGSLSEERAARAVHIEAKAVLTTKRRERTQLEATKVLARIEGEQVAKRFSAARRDLATEIGATEFAIIEAEERRAIVIRAPVAGRVTGVQARIGRFVAAGSEQLVLVPGQSLYHAQLRVPTRAIGFVRPGQTVRLRYDAFPYQRYGAALGRVREVSKAVVASGEPGAASGTYLVTVTLEREEIAAYGERYPLRPDMTLTADIELDRRSLLQWLIDPLVSAAKLV